MAGYIALSKLRHYLTLNEETGELIWNVNRRKFKAGTKAGHLSRGYWYVKLEQVNIAVHRVVYQMHHNLQYLCPGMQIDHIDLDRGNNNPENLRPANASKNAANTNRQRNRKQDLPKNIRIKDNGNGRSYYELEMMCNSKRYVKTFPMTDEGLERAIQYKKELGESLFGEYFRP